MDPAVTIAGYWLLFAGTHIGLSVTPVRAPLARRLGEFGFSALFSLIAAGAFTLLVRAYAALRFEGVRGISLADFAGAREVLLVLSVAAVVLALASLARYAGSPYALYSEGHDGEPRGLERVSRHAFFAAMTLFGTAHALLATRLVGTVFFGALAAFAMLGAWHQDRKLLARRGEPYARFLAVTSTIPFAAIVARRQRLVLRELPWLHLAGALAIAFGLRSVHGAILSAGGVWVIAVFVGGAALLMFEAWWRGRHATRRRPDALGTAPRRV